MALGSPSLSITQFSKSINYCHQWDQFEMFNDSYIISADNKFIDFVLIVYVNISIRTFYIYFFAERTKRQVTKYDHILCKIFKRPQMLTSDKNYVKFFLVSFTHLIKYTINKCNNVHTIVYTIIHKCINYSSSRLQLPEWFLITNIGIDNLVSNSDKASTSVKQLIKTKMEVQIAWFFTVVQDEILVSMRSSNTFSWSFDV